MNDDSLDILIADDNDSDRFILTTILKKLGHKVRAAQDGVEALVLFEDKRPDLILLDALMPRMDGLDCARQMKNLSGDSLIPIIFLTSLKDASSLADCLEAGGDDFLSKPYSKVILQAKIQAFIRMRKLHVVVQNQRDQISQHNDHLVHEQEIAKMVFDNIAHPGCINAKNITYLLSPMAVFNGDMLLAARDPSGGMYVLLGDFTGHGLPAAIGAMPASEIFYGMTNKGFSMEEILREINKKLKTILPVNVFCCMCMISMNFREKWVKLWVAGLPDIFIYRVKNRAIEHIKSRSLPLGVLSDERFKVEPEIYELEYGDRLYLWSDGIHEAKDDAGEMFGTTELQRIFKQNVVPNRLFEEIKTGVRQFTGGKAQDDDYTMAEVIMLTPEIMEDEAGQEIKTKKITNNQPIMDWTISCELRTDTLKTFNPLPLMTHIIMEVPGLKAHSGKLYTILAELYSNSLEHGILGLSSNLKESAAGFSQYYRERDEKLKAMNFGTLTVILTHTPSKDGGQLFIRIEDCGVGFDYQNKMAGLSPIDGYCGRGIPLVRTLCERLEYKGKGNIVEAVYAWAYRPVGSAN